ncbi:peptide ABC transporter substrate-binding protein [Natrialba hulunbeirensis JCM 10989]|uniref:Peptide ABC transporter substrate-binding protein n=1 Tax=Natrialba hulunbeirensis JCM 10989 TaxID=1227493 RepID=L9ZQA9_9EURY|nr:ABC transporter substrate-binding protein [Natrialba hulunbeirensis]ELY88690.1 peptide ABC transporter substrate-binding protein [Natrialba hulunbeirensis JCM 10989]
MVENNKRYRTGINRRRVLQGLTAAGVIGAAGCLGSDDEETDDTYTVADGTDAESMNFIQVSDNNTNNRLALVMDSAYTVTSDDQIFPLWMDVEDTGDAQVYVATLRDNLQWGGDYGQMTASDWVYMIQEVHQGEGNWALSEAAGNWDGTHVEETGELEFQIELENPNADWPFEPDLWGSYCMPQGLLEPYVDAQDGEGLDQDDEVQELAYAGNLGAYTFERWDRDSEFVAVRNDDYYMNELDADDFPDYISDEQVEAWQNAPSFTEFSYQAIDEDSTRMSALGQGEIEETNIPSTRVEQFEGRPDVDVMEVPYSYLTIMAYNQRMNGWEELRTREVRQALSMAIDKVEITENILRGYAEVAHTFQPEWSEWYDESEVTQFGEGDSYDPDAARDLLEENLSSGYGYDSDGTLLDPDGEQVTLTMVYSRGTETTATTAEFMGDELSDLGIEVEFDSVTFDQMIPNYVQNSWQGDEDDQPWTGGPNNDGPRDGSASEEDWDLMYGINFNTYPRTPAATDAFWTEQAPTNYFGYVPDADMASLFSTVRTSADQSERQETLAEIFGILSEDQPVNFVAMGDDIIGYQGYVDGPEEEFGQAWDRHTWAFDEA